MNEDRLVGLLRRKFGVQSPRIVRGIGDDAAVLSVGVGQKLWILTTDMLIEGVHFEREWIGARQLGHKALAVNLSDMAAMGGEGRYYVVSLALPRGLGQRWISEFYRGMSDLGRRYDASLVGGDLSRSRSDICISLAVLGESSRGRVLFRSGGRAGDYLFVTGTLGKSAAGLRLLRSRSSAGRSRYMQEAVRRHRAPEPRCAEGLWLARRGLPSAMMDISDGLSMDLPRMCAESGTGAEVHGDRLPVFTPCRRWGLNPLDLALNGGEDYELLFAVPPKRAPQLESRYPGNLASIHRIGRLTSGTTVEWAPHPGDSFRPLPQGGFDHFRGRNFLRREMKMKTRDRSLFSL